MKTSRLLFLAAFAAVFCSNASAQSKMVLNVWTGLRSGADYHFVNPILVHDRIVAPDVGYLDFGKGGEYREWFVGGGYKTLVSKHLKITNELLFVQAAGDSSGGARYVQLWTGVNFTLSPEIEGEAVIFPYIPLNEAGTKQWVVERIKLEYKLSSFLKVGAGYGAYQFGTERWQHRPLVTATVNPFEGEFGSLEFWLQEFKDRAQLQLRYVLVK
ncbi:hypothetical protein A2988_05000 [Candidatus Azambacteria bacterium RIFCSPLOWO2_01_FULL_46_25]|uniref:Outer membrane protein beta-barrel domain-containing protein n=1 Tax=Candidatus Azambacteria bacterium RIFCSPLOWO2_01_FULL_46_25 TaxID=1797298 RepID=A0A1F5BT43_9BACT|nr:MAG: hypothetical protein A2988_05000 [Candidatus Azambacteria bacterium RIFCSPLOWO2_01_FULL_46_25]